MICKGTPLPLGELFVPLMGVSLSKVQNITFDKVSYSLRFLKSL